MKLTGKTATQHIFSVHLSKGIYQDKRAIILKSAYATGTTFVDIYQAKSAMLYQIQCQKHIYDRPLSANTQVNHLPCRRAKK